MYTVDTGRTNHTPMKGHDKFVFVFYLAKDHGPVIVVRNIWMFQPDSQFSLRKERERE